ncbi:GFA family protein [Qipengyuania sphaerica]|uniref:GFA family protein n=1 Tax=Qipengyuania sphaerica TaxID=2867243 RepID=UPI001C8681B4|nr:GFA family protein [Qipengyuania sphaerica]MBX7541052.1 GFA family protein [Qipengyuania sphaerica]
MRIEGACHCGEVRFEAQIEPPVELLECNCSICSMTGFLHLIVPHSDFTLLSGKEALESYRFGSGQAEHLFCKSCGIKSFYQPRSHPGSWSVHWKCVEGHEDIAHDVTPFDGRNWEAARARLDP